MAIRDYDDHVYLEIGETVKALPAPGAGRRMTVTYIIASGAAGGSIAFHDGTADFAVFPLTAVGRVGIFAGDKKSTTRIRGGIGKTVTLTATSAAVAYTIGFQEVVG